MGLNASSFTRLSARKRRTFGASPGAIRAISASSRSTSGVARIFPAALEDQVVLRVEPAQLDPILQALATGREDVGEDLRVEEEGGANVEAVPARGLHRARATADGLRLLEERDLEPLRGEKKSGGQPARAGSDDRDRIIGQGAAHQHQDRITRTVKGNRGTAVPARTARSAEPMRKVPPPCVPPRRMSRLAERPPGALSQLGAIAASGEAQVLKPVRARLRPTSLPE
jgi:hypothetical protein